ncbi:MAG: oligosaccharide flippase family protein [Dokdonella sp.]
MSTRSLAVRNTLFSSLGIYTEYLLGMLTSILIARYMGPHDYGIYGLALWLASLGVMLTNGGTTTAMIKFVAELRGKDDFALIKPVATYLRRRQIHIQIGVLGIAVLLFVFAGKRVVPELSASTFALLLLAVSLRAPYMLNIAVGKGFENFRATAIIALVACPINLVLIVAAFLLKQRVQGFIVVYAVSSAVFYLVSRWQAHKLMPEIASSRLLPDDLVRRLQHHLRIVSVVVIVGFFSTSEVEVLLLNLFDTAASAGYFRVSYQLASAAALLIPGVFSAVLLPMMARAVSESAAAGQRRFLQSTMYLLLLAAPLAAFGATLSPSVVAILYGPRYAPAESVLAWCLVCTAFVTVSAGASSMLMSADRQASVLIVTICCAVLKVGLGSLLIHEFGLTGAVASFSVVSVVYISANIGLAQRFCGARLPWARVARIVAAAALAGIPAYALERALPPWPALLFGFPALVVVYGSLTLWFRCWDRDDLVKMRALAARFGTGRWAVLDHVLAWAAARAPDNVM